MGDKIQKVTFNDAYFTFNQRVSTNIVEGDGLLNRICQESGHIVR